MRAGVTERRLRVVPSPDLIILGSTYLQPKNVPAALGLAADVVQAVGLCACSLRSHCRTQTVSLYHAAEGGVIRRNEEIT